ADAPIVSGDLDGDGRRELVFGVRRPGGYGIRAVDADGRVRWTNEETNPRWQLPLLADIDGDGAFEVVAERRAGGVQHLAALDGRTGSVRWSVPIIDGGGLTTAAAGSLDPGGPVRIVYARSRSLVVLDESGRQLWTAPTTGNSFNEIAIADVTGDARREILVTAHVYPTSEELILCFDADGGLVWSARLEGMAYSSPVVADFGEGARRVGVGCSSRYYLLDGDTGKPVWEADLGYFSGHIYRPLGAALADTSGDGVPDVILAGPQSAVRALDGRTGGVLWEYRVQDGDTFCPPVV